MGVMRRSGARRVEATRSKKRPRTVAERIGGSRSRRRRGRGVEETHRRGGEEREDTGHGGTAVEAADESVRGGGKGRGRGASAVVCHEKAKKSTWVIPIVATPARTYSELAAARTVTSRRAMGLATTLAVTGVPAMNADMALRAVVR